VTGHELRRIDEERCADGSYRWRWVCSCATRTGRNCVGHWNYQSDNVARVAHERHADKFKGPKALRNLLKLKG
jgi:hypothetical protein